MTQTVHAVSLVREKGVLGSVAVVTAGIVALTTAAIAESLIAATPAGTSAVSVLGTVARTTRLHWRIKQPRLVKIEHFLARAAINDTGILAIKQCEYKTQNKSIHLYKATGSAK